MIKFTEFCDKAAFKECKKQKKGDLKRGFFGRACF